MSYWSPPETGMPILLWLLYVNSASADETQQAIIAATFKAILPGAFPEWKWHITGVLYHKRIMQCLIDTIIHVINSMLISVVLCQCTNAMYGLRYLVICKRPFPSFQYKYQYTLPPWRKIQLHVHSISFQGLFLPEALAVISQNGCTCSNEFVSFISHTQCILPALEEHHFALH